MKDLSIENFNYDLPPDRIAGYPLPERDLSKLLIFKKNWVTDDIYRNVSAYLPPDSLIVFNNSKVIEARLIFSKPGGGKIEIFCLEPAPGYAGMQDALSCTSSVRWTCLIGGASKWKPGQTLEQHINHNDRNITLEAVFEARTSDAFIIRFSWNDDAITFAELLHQAGSMPLPPYIKRAVEASDKTRYQTIFAEPPGSVAAPTAGLHFTPAILAALKAKNIESAFVTLHVGAGTFKPVKASKMEDHEMHAELIDVDLYSLKRITEYLEKHITAVGTTSIRTLESLYWMGIKVLARPELEVSDIDISQWFAYENMDSAVSPKQALAALEQWMLQHKMTRLITKTQLLIAPGYRFRIASALVTNFHQPKSTLLLLVAAMAGGNWREIYEHALAHDFRFLSYGDGSLIFREDET